MARCRVAACSLLIVPFGVGVLPSQTHPEDVVLHVSRAGDDAWSGQRATRAPGGDDGPFATVHRAQAAVRELLAARRGEVRAIVEVHDGTFFLPKPLVFGPEDSGTAEAPVVWRAAAGARPVLSGGVPVEGWKVSADGSWQASLPDGVVATQLFVGDERRLRPRLPAGASEYYRVERQVEPTESNRGKGHDRFGYTGAELDPSWHDLDAVEVLAFHIWSASRMRILALDVDERVVTFTGRTRTAQSWGQFRQGHRYRVINVREALRAPGQWYFDRGARALTYLPAEGEQPERVRAVVPRLPAVVRFDGDAASERPVEYLRLEGLTFAHAAWELAPGGQSFPQAEVQLGAAVTLRGARHCELRDCAVRHVGGYAVEFGPACRDDSLVGCELADLGGGGVKIGAGGGGGSWPTGGEGPFAGAAAAVERVTVEGCEIAHGGRLHPAAVGVWIGHASHNRVVRNVIHDFYYTGVSVGWSWGYHDSRARDNEIAYNEIFDIGQGVLSDLAGVYTLGVSPGTRVHHNRIHDVEAFDYGGWGLYTDEGSTGIVMEHNVVYRTKTGSFHQHYGRDNVIRNNVFADSRQWQLQRTRAEDHLSFTFERNIVFWHGGPLLHGNWSGDGFRMAHNVYWNDAGPVIFPGDLDLGAWQRERGQDEGSVVADPRFLDPAAGDFRLREDSPAHALGVSDSFPFKSR